MPERLSKLVAEQIKHGSWIRKMFEEGILLKEKYGVNNVFDLTLGNPVTDPPEEFLTALNNVAANEKPFVHGYMLNQGYVETRKCIAKGLAEETDLPFIYKNIVMTVGAAGALNIVLRAILNPNDEVIVIAPYFAEYNSYIINARCQVVISNSKKDFTLNIEDIEKKINEKTKAVLINSPCNPSGKIITEENLIEISELLKRKSNQYKKEIYLISDEPYKKLIFDGLTFYSPVKYYDNTLIAMSYSKYLSIAGERIGYLAISPNCKFKTEIFEYAVFLNRTLGFINAPALMQRIIAKTYDLTPDIKTYQRKRDRIYEALISSGYDVVKPEGTFYVFPKSPISDDVKWVSLLQKSLVLTTPGSGFSFPGYFRIAFCVNDDVIEGAVPILKKAISDFTPLPG